MIPRSPNLDILTVSYLKNKTKLSCPLVSFILTTPVSMAKTSSFSLSSTWTWGQGEYNEMRKLGNSHPKELKSISSESRNLTAHPLLFYFIFFLNCFSFYNHRPSKTVISQQEPGISTVARPARQQEGRRSPCWPSLLYKRGLAWVCLTMTTNHFLLFPEPYSVSRKHQGVRQFHNTLWQES